MFFGPSNRLASKSCLNIKQFLHNIEELKKEGLSEKVLEVKMFFFPLIACLRVHCTVE